MRLRAIEGPPRRRGCAVRDRHVGLNRCDMMSSVDLALPAAALGQGKTVQENQTNCKVGGRVCSPPGLKEGEEVTRETGKRNQGVWKGGFWVETRAPGWSPPKSTATHTASHSQSCEID